MHAFEAEGRRLAAEGARVIRRYVRGFGPTRFLSGETMRNGQQVAHALDVVRWQALCSWAFDVDTFDRTARVFDNPNFVDVVIHTYRFMLGNVEDDPTLQSLDNRLADRPPITAPSVTIDGAADPLKPAGRLTTPPCSQGLTSI